MYPLFFISLLVPILYGCGGGGSGGKDGGDSGNAGRYGLHAQQMDIMFNQKSRYVHSVWTKTFANIDNGYILSMQTDSKGDILSLLLFKENTYAFGVVKTDTDGNPIWSKKFLSDQRIHISGMALDSRGNIYFCGDETTAVDYQKDPKTKRQINAILIKVDSRGDLLWKKQFIQPETDSYFSYISISGNSLYAVGGSELDDGANNNDGKLDSSDTLITKFNLEGDLAWYKNFGGSSDDTLIESAIDHDGNLIACGYTDSSDGDITYGTYGWRDGLILKISPRGDILWHTVAGGTGRDLFNTLVTDSQNNIYAAGYTTSIKRDMTDDGGFPNGWIVKITSDGQKSWQKAIGGSLEDSYLQAYITSDDTLYLTGYTHSHDGDFSNDYTYDDAILTKIKGDDVLYNRVIGNSEKLNEWLSSITVDHAGHLYLGGADETVDPHPLMIKYGKDR